MAKKAFATSLEDETIRRIKKIGFENECKINEVIEAIVWKSSLKEIVERIKAYKEDKH